MPADPIDPVRLNEIIQRTSHAALERALARPIEEIAQQLAAEILEDLEFRYQMRTLLREAFTAALASLGQPVDKG